MYLKSLEIVGFKSFAERTKLDFERGMTAIVGPNGCGKSNISDAVRWVLGEQSAKALRGGKMEDVIFNGTDTHKPLGMAEVTLTLAECEASLGTEYNEVTITRRVFRTGEGQYFINKTLCRLKDIQRLFMDTGVSTNSYSLMEQGRIDRILSSRPEDRREVFEEASGITKFKADKKEAIRKLEHTEANLLRLADIIREVRRQIISLQRQAGKAKRYKQLQEQLRSYDIFATRERLNVLNQDIAGLESRLTEVSQQEESLRNDLEQIEGKTATMRSELAATEKEIGTAMEASVQARTELDRAHELIKINKDRILELKNLSERDSRDADEARSNLEQHKTSLQELLGQMEKAVAARDAAQKELAVHTEALNQHEETVEKLRRLMHDLGAEAVDLESRMAKLQNEIHSLEAQERTSIIHRERLAAEQVELQRAVEVYESRQAEMKTGLEGLKKDVEGVSGRITELSAQRSDKAGAISNTEKAIADLRTKAAARKAQIDLLANSQERAEGFPGGAKLLLDRKSKLDIDRSSILGSLAEQLRTKTGYQKAVEAALRAWLDAVLVKDASGAANILAELESKAKGSARLLSLASEPTSSDFVNGPGEKLIDQVECAAGVENLLARLLHNVRVVETLTDIPSPVPARAIFVTKSGSLVRGDGSFECWMPEANETNPVARRQKLVEWSEEMADLDRRREELEKNVALLRTDERAFQKSIDDARIELEDRRRELAQREGEFRIISQEAKQAKDRAETVTWELNVLREKQASGGDRRGELHEEIERVRVRQGEIRTLLAAKTDELRELEQERSEKSTAVTEHRVHFAECRQQVEHLSGRKEPQEARIRELEHLIQNRSKGVSLYHERMQELEKSISETEKRLQPLQERVSVLGEQLDKARSLREVKAADLASCDKVLHEKRSTMDQIRGRKGHIDIELAEQRVRRQSLVERVAADYHITPDQMMSEPEPAWEDGVRLDREALETAIAEIRTKLEAMGPVNLVAIEEHQELEERYTFLSQQQEDLVRAKQQLMDMIKRINSTTTEMFSQTFNQVNENFQGIFKQLFGGGSAKLVLVNEEDVLDSGIEIIARPPGKKLQTVSLLSGGERTMTAVALLFSLYMVKPSPFCLLDELDAALDEANIGRFIKMVQGFMERSQFVVITHNRQTISAADVLYGVTMQQSGISKIVSVKFSHHERKQEAAEEAPTPDEEEELEVEQPDSVSEPDPDKEPEAEPV